MGGLVWRLRMYLPVYFFQVFTALFPMPATRPAPARFAEILCMLFFCHLPERFFFYAFANANNHENLFFKNSYDSIMQYILILSNLSAMVASFLGDVDMKQCAFKRR